MQEAKSGRIAFTNREKGILSGQWVRIAPLFDAKDLHLGGNL